MGRLDGRTKKYVPNTMFQKAKSLAFVIKVGLTVYVMVQWADNTFRRVILYIDKSGILSCEPNIYMS